MNENKAVLKLKSLVFNVMGMTCTSCASNIEKNVAALDGVKEARINFGTEQAFIDYDPIKVTLIEIKESIENLGLDTVDAQILADNGLVRSALKPIKILANGELKLKVTVTASAFSESAKEQIEQAGGTATVQ